jgi:hypothetical protein
MNMLCELTYTTNQFPFGVILFIGVVMLVALLAGLAILLLLMRRWK